MERPGTGPFLFGGAMELIEKPQVEGRMEASPERQEATVQVRSNLSSMTEKTPPGQPLRGR